MKPCVNYRIDAALRGLPYKLGRSDVRAWWQHSQGFLHQLSEL